MLITAAEERKKGLTALYIDGEYAVSVDTVTLASMGFKEGKDITDEELHELIQASSIARAKEKALFLLEYRRRTRKEIYDKLIPMFGEDAADAAVGRLEQLGLIDDEGYARDYAVTLIEQKHFSKERVRYELLKKGIDRELADEILDELEPEPVEQIKALLDTKYSRRLSNEKDVQRTINSLRAMGFKWGDIKEALRDYCDEE